MREHEIQIHPGSRQWWNVEHIPLPGEADRPNSVLIVAAEVTEQVLARRRLEKVAATARENVSRLQSLIDSMREPVIVTDAHGDILEMNPAARELYGLAAAGADRRPLQAFAELFEFRTVNGDPLPLDAWPLTRACRGDTFDGLELYVRRQDTGRDWIASFSGSSVRDSSGLVAYGVITSHDLTLQKRNEKQLAAFRDALEAQIAEQTAAAERRAAEMASELTLAAHRERHRLAQILHDHVQQLLVAARLRTALLQRRLDGPELRFSLEQVDELINEAIDATRSLAVETAPPVLYDSGLAPALEWLARQMEEKYRIKVSLSCEAQSDPSAYETRLLLFDAVHELLFNVVKHAHTEQARVSVSRRENGDYCAAVSDQGIGFDSSTPRSDKGPGGGFGLSDIRRRVQLSGGGVEVESIPGRGTTISVVVPASLPGRSTA